MRVPLTEVGFLLFVLLLSFFRCSLSSVNLFDFSAFSSSVNLGLRFRFCVVVGISHTLSALSSLSAILRKNKANKIVKSITRLSKKTKWMLPQISLDVVGYDGLVDHIRVQTRDGVGCYG